MAACPAFIAMSIAALPSLFNAPEDTFSHADVLVFMVSSVLFRSLSKPLLSATTL